MTTVVTVFCNCTFNFVFVDTLKMFIFKIGCLIINCQHSSTKTQQVSLSICYKYLYNCRRYEYPQTYITIYMKLISNSWKQRDVKAVV